MYTRQGCEVIDPISLEDEGQGVTGQKSPEILCEALNIFWCFPLLSFPSGHDETTWLLTECFILYVLHDCVALGKYELASLAATESWLHFVASF